VDSGLSASAEILVTATVLSVQVTPAYITTAAGTRVRLTASAVLTGDITREITQEADWTVAGTGIAFISGGNGEPVWLNGVAPGETTLTCHFGDEAAWVPVTVTDAILDSVEMVPDTFTMPVGASQDFFFVGTYTDGTRADLTPSSVWTTDAPDIALVASSPPGRVNALSPGAATLTATFEGFAGTAQVEVSDAQVVGMQVLPALITLPAGEPIQVNAYGIYSDNTQRPLTDQVIWTSSDESVVMVSNAFGQQGRAEGLAPGTATLTASLGAIEDTATFQVVDAHVDGILVVPFVAVMTPGYIQQGDAWANYSNGSTLKVTEDAVWQTTDPAVVQVSNVPGTKGRLQAVGPGQATIAANFGGAAGTGTIYVSEEEITQLILWPPQLFLAPGISQQVHAVGRFADNNPQTQQILTAWAVWESSDPAVATVDNFPLEPGVITAHAPGTFTVTARFGELIAEQAFTVQNVTPTSLQVSPPDPTLSVDAAQPFVALASFSNGETVDVTRDALFTSNDNSVLTMLEYFPGVSLALAPGTAIIEAEFQGISGFTTATVIDAQPTDVVLSPVNPIFDRWQNQPFYATAIYDDGSTGDITQLCTWGSSDPEILLVLDEPFAKGYAVGLAAGSATVTVSCFGLEDATSATVR
jgi:uncharacterized protein YjdB